MLNVWFSWIVSQKTGAQKSTCFCLPAVEENLPVIVLRTHGEVNPIRGAALLLDEFVEHPAVFISRIEQQTGIAYHLFRT